MHPWLVWVVFVIACVLLGFVGYHFSVRTLRFSAAAFAAVVIVIVTRYGLAHPAGASGDLVNSFIRGFDDLSAALFRPLLGRDISPPGRVGWLVIIVVLVFGYRELEVWAMRWQPPTVDTSRLGGDQQSTQKSDASDKPDEGTTDEQRRLYAELRFRLPAVEVRAPATLPGGTKSSELASIAEDSGINGSGLAGAIINFFNMLWPNPRRYQVRVWIEHDKLSAHDSKQATASMRVTVDLEDFQSGGSLVTKTLVAPDLDHAASAVAGYVARHIFNEDPTAPPWCVGSCDGDDLAAMLNAERQRVLPEFPRDVCRSRHEQISILERFKLDAGVARYELAQLHDLDGNRVKALRLHAMNREDYPRFWRGRYRLGMSLEMITNPEFELPDKATTDMLESLHTLRRWYPVKGAADCYERIYPGKLSPEIRNELLTAARKELREVRQQLTLWRVIWEMLWHRDERTIRKLYLRLRERQSFHDAARVAELLVAVRQSLEAPPDPKHKYKHHTTRAMRIAAAITGDSAAIKARLENKAPPDTPKSPDQKLPGKNAKKTRWLPVQRRTPSWQAAYNTACVYAALGQPCRDEAKKDEMAEYAVISLTRAVNDRDCEMERPWDWISADPDFSCLKSSKIFQRFLDNQKQEDYPADKTCIFCGKPDADIKITRERMFPKWINEVLPPGVVGPEISCKRSALCDPLSVRRWPATEAADHTGWAVCQPCNAGWITQLERDFQRLLPAMIKERNAPLTPPEQNTLATWAVLQAAVFEYVWTGDPVLTSADRYFIKKCNKPPDGVQVRLAVLQPDRHLLRALGRVYERSGQDDKALCLTITIGRLVIQVLRGPGASSQGLRAAGRLGTDVIPIFPHPETVPWPPPKPLDDERLHTLANNFGWGIDPFENDHAADFLSELADMAADRRSERMRAALALPAGYVEIREASEAVGAAALVAAADGMPTRAPVDAVESVQARTVLGNREFREFRDLARVALSRLANSESEWRDLWDEAGLLAEASSTLDRIRASLDASCS